MFSKILMMAFGLSFSFSALAEPKYRMEVLTQRSGVVWGFDFLPDGRILMTERSGKLVVFDPKSKSVKPVPGTPEVVARGQGGLLDVRVHPEFKKTGWIYFTYSEPESKKTATTALARAKLQDEKLSDFQKLFSANGASDETIHFGSRIEFDGKGHLFISVGDRGERDRAQKLSAHQGKILRLNEDGSVPKDNPFVDRNGAKPEIWSYGHRNPQGLARHPQSGELWEAEMGPRGGDEVNVIRKGANYGWPVVTYGREYWGPKIGEGKEKEGINSPVVHYTPSISPSGIAFYQGDRMPEWKGNLFLANLGGMHLRRLVLKGKDVIQQEELFKDKARFRQVRQGPDGYLYFSTDDGKVGRVVRVE